MFIHGDCFIDIPVAELFASTDYGQLLANTDLWRTHFQAYRTIELCRHAHLTLVNHDAVSQCRTVEIGILWYINPVVIDSIMRCFLCSKLQTVRFYKPLMTGFLIAMHQTIIIVDIRVRLRSLANLYKPVTAIKCCHLMLCHFSVLVNGKYVQYQVFPKRGLVLYIEYYFHSNTGFSYTLLSFISYLNHCYAQCSDDKQYSRHYHHRRLVMAYQRQDDTTTESSDNLRYADSAIEESQVSAHVSIALQSIGDKGKRHS